MMIFFSKEMKTKPKYKSNEFRFDMYKHSTNVKIAKPEFKSIQTFLYCVKNVNETKFLQFLIQSPQFPSEIVLLLYQIQSIFFFSNHLIFFFFNL